jgi:hypothetical protein
VSSLRSSSEPLKKRPERVSEGSAAEDVASISYDFDGVGVLSSAKYLSYRRGDGRRHAEDDRVSTRQLLREYAAYLSNASEEPKWSTVGREFEERHHIARNTTSPISRMFHRLNARADYHGVECR